MDTQDQERHDRERIIRRAQELGHDPERVARAMRHTRPAPAERQPVMEVRDHSRIGARMARLFMRAGR